MYTNPIHPPKKPLKEYLPIHVHCVLDDFEDYTDEIIQMIRDYCNDRNIHFMTRLYSSYKYSDDRYYIRSLPAFHIYIKKSYTDTFYPNTKPIQHITDTIDIYSKQLIEEHKRREKWKKFVGKYFNC